jgi:hypothetical protein
VGLITDRTRAALLLGIALSSTAFAAGGGEPQLATVAYEARRAVAIINDFYAEHHACPQPTRPEELKQLQSDLGDGFSAERQGQFVELRGISMVSGPWLYYASPRHPDRCTLWRKLGWDPALIWRRHRYGANWAYDPGDGTPERPLNQR